MILVDTSVWINHFRTTSATLARLLIDGLACTHPAVVGEVLMGSIRDRARLERDLLLLPVIREASHEETRQFVTKRELFAMGIGYVDAQLLASATAAGETLWSADRRLRSAAEAVGIAFVP